VFGAEDVGDAFHVLGVADEAPGEAIAGIAVNHLDDVILELEAGGVVTHYSLSGSLSKDLTALRP
jgi:hypothetical protein